MWVTRLYFCGNVFKIYEAALVGGCLNGLAPTDVLAPLARRVEQSRLRVRLVEARDRSQLEALCRRLHAETFDHELGYDERKVAAHMNCCIDPLLPQLGIVVEDKVTGAIAGFVYGGGGDHMFAPVKQAVCQILYVVPEMRGSLAPFLLLRSFVRRAINGGAAIISIHVSSGIRTRGTHSFLAKMHFTFTGGNYALIARSSTQSSTAPQITGS